MNPTRTSRWRRNIALVLMPPALAVLAFQVLQLPGGGFSTAAHLTPAGQAKVVVPPGFVANVFASGLVGPRFHVFGPDGALYVAEGWSDRIAVLHDDDKDGTSDRMSTFASGLASPHSAVWHGGALYVGVPTGVVELRDADGDGRAESRRTVVDGYPTDGHGTRTVLFLPDGRMLVSVGSSCNVCEEQDPRRAAIVVYDGTSGTGEKVFAKGLRNAVGLALHPETRALWVTVNERDWLGDDLPPDTVRIVREGQDLGWPRCDSGTIVDPDFGGKDGCNGIERPEVELQAHSAPLGLAFYTGTAFPAEYRGDLFIAYHGSWNRSVPTGYKVVRVNIEGGRAAGKAEDFATGFAVDNHSRILGRPAGVTVGPDGALYVSDDKGGFIYRIAYKP